MDKATSCIHDGITSKPLRWACGSFLHIFRDWHGICHSKEGGEGHEILIYNMMKWIVEMTKGWNHKTCSASGVKIISDFGNPEMSKSETPKRFPHTPLFLDLCRSIPVVIGSGVIGGFSKICSQKWLNLFWWSISKARRGLLLITNGIQCKKERLSKLR